MNVDKITGFDPDVELEDWGPMDEADLETPSPVQRGHFYYNDEDIGIMAGVWDCTPFTGKMAPYAVEEFMYVIEGSIIMELEDGSKTTISAGESFIIPKGLVCRWIQNEYVKKHFVIFGNENAKAHDNPAQFGIITPKANDPVVENKNVDPSMIIGAVPVQHGLSYYTDASEQFTVGMWHSQPFERPAFEFNHFDLMIIVEGVATVSDGAGDDQVFKAGDAVFVPKGAQYKWKNDEFVSKIYCAFSPKAVEAISSAAE
ncbi:MAG: DUF861 domain-containing protein [Rhodospirillales bacterium]|jgi:uncharacterized cupin superfamily protein|nr:DUF861 domain-containing protein [Rhodospirillales bacterium]